MTGTDSGTGEGGGLCRFGPHACAEAALAFRRDGAVVIDGLFDRARLEQLLERLTALYPGYVGVGIPDNSFEVGKLRFHAPLRFEAPFDCSDIIAHPVLEELLSALLGDEFVFESFGVITSLPGADEQHTHCDGGSLFPETGIDRIAPPAAVTVAIPMIDADAVSGSTRFWLGSHRSGSADGNGTEPTIPVGSLAIWDYRVYHAGLPNRGKVPRPYLYLTVCRPFWIDHKNFADGRNAKLLASQSAVNNLSRKDRARFVRAVWSE